jgi:branched-chain amino acid transport system substrate-binding protein
MAPDGLYEAGFINDAGVVAAEGAYITFVGIAPSKLVGKGAEWYANYKRRFNAEPEVFASYSYEAMKVALNAMQRAGVKDRAKIRDALLATKEYAGILGTWSFDGNGDTTLTQLSGRQIKGGQFDDGNAVILEAPR